ncbi:MAG: hypothetical protein HYX76_00810 [Acidobacteria bacterium]|nr:hypothetical protein [Acidobacteriota bacterium]
MFSGRVARRIGLVLIAALSLPPATRAAAGPTDAILYRIFLNDGATLVSYGEYVRLDDRVIFSTPLGPLSPNPQLQLVTIPASAVDWHSTEQYAESARYGHYVATRAETDYTLMSAEVARALNEVGLTTDPAKRLQIAENARRTLAAWPLANYGYRAQDVRQALGLLDEVISELRAGAGESRFELSLVATVLPPPARALMDPPTARESIDQALKIAALTVSAAERLSLLQSIQAVLQASGAELSADWSLATRAMVGRDLRKELDTERAYVELTRQTFARANTLAARADVRGVEAVVRAIAKQDRKLGRKRPESVSALVAAVQAKLDAARRLRLARDQWSMRQEVYQRYRGVIAPSLDAIRKSEPLLDDIKALAGPSPRHLIVLERHIARAAHDLALISPPAELQDAHAAFMSGVRFADNAVHIRRRAIVTNDVKDAWDASSAAAAARMLFSKANGDLSRSFRKPELQ